MKDREDKVQAQLKRLEDQLARETTDNTILKEEVQEMQTLCPNLNKLKREHEKMNKETMLKLIS